jgi:hypothetical protein
MSSYRIAVGWNVALGSLTVIDPQPRNGEVMPVERTYSDGGARDEGLYAKPTWDMFSTDEEFAAVLAQFGLDAADEVKVTYYGRNEVFSWARYNGVAVVPRVGQDGDRSQFFLRGYSILIKQLVEIEE